MIPITIACTYFGFIDIDTGVIPYARDMTTLLNRSPSQKCQIDPLCCPIHDFMLFLDELAQERDIEEVSLLLAEVLHAFLQSEIPNSGPKN